MIENKEVNRMTIGAWKRPQSGCVSFVVHLSNIFCQVEVQSEGEDTDEGTGRYIDWYRGFAILHSLHSCKATAKLSLILGGFTVSRKECILSFPFLSTVLILYSLHQFTSSSMFFWHMALTGCISWSFCKSIRVLIHRLKGFGGIATPRDFLIKGT